MLKSMHRYALICPVHGIYIFIYIYIYTAYRRCMLVCFSKQSKSPLRSLVEFGQVTNTSLFDSLTSGPLSNQPSGKSH